MCAKYCRGAYFFSPLFLHREAVCILYLIIMHDVGKGRKHPVAVGLPVNNCEGNGYPARFRFGGGEGVPRR